VRFFVRRFTHAAENRQNELLGIPWMSLLTAEAAITINELQVSDASSSDYISRRQAGDLHWFVVWLKAQVSSDSAGKTTTFLGVPPGGWFWRGTV
jgi:hypothetical protein